jgi:hypothetical protein
MSEKTMAASNPNRLIGWSVTSAASSGLRQRSRNDPTLVLISRYSGKYRPACRINQTGGGKATLPLRAERKQSTDAMGRSIAPLNIKREILKEVSSSFISA